MKSKTDEIQKEADTYTDYCKAIDYANAKAEEYVEKMKVKVENAKQMLVAAFPYGVGPAIIAATIQAKTIIRDAQELVEYVKSGEILTDMIAAIPLPDTECPPRPKEPTPETEPET